MARLLVPLLCAPSLCLDAGRCDLCALSSAEKGLLPQADNYLLCHSRTRASISINISIRLGPSIANGRAVLWSATLCQVAGKSRPKERERERERKKTGTLCCGSSPSFRVRPTMLWAARVQTWQQAGQSKLEKITDEFKVCERERERASRGRRAAPAHKCSPTSWAPLSLPVAPLTVGYNPLARNCCPVAVSFSGARS